MLRSGLGFIVALAVLLSACSTSGAAPDPGSSSSAAAPQGPNPPKVEWVRIPSAAEPAPFIVSEMARAEADHKRLLVYVGATWCQPCQRFHKAAEAGELDSVFPELRLVELDNDADASVIQELNCGSRLIPMFSAPDSSGHCTSKRIEGGIKGDGAVGFIAPRLRDLLGR
jgi:hypothetical protein